METPVEARPNVPPSQSTDGLLNGKVVSVADGDTITILVDETQYRIRLNGIDCPELHQAFGQKAKEATAQLAQGKTVTIKPTGKDKYGRTLADVILPDGRSLNHELVRLGCAWWYRKYSDDETLAKLESEAQKEKRGLWAQENPTPPWEWRQQQREKGRQPEVKVEVVPNGVEIVALLPNPKGEDKGHEQVVIANRTEAAVDLDGWQLRDRAGNTFRLAVKVSANGRRTITMTDPTMPLNNDGDEVLLIDPKGVVRCQVVYGESEVRSGQWVEFEAAPP